MFRTLLTAASTAAISIALPAFGQCDAHYGSPNASQQPTGTLTSYQRPADRSASADIVQTAAQAENFKTLLAAVRAAGLTDALRSNGPFTVFAPTDDAFSKLPKRQLNNLLKPENRDQLREILSYHVVPQRLAARDVVRMAGVRSLTKERLDFNMADDTAMVDNATITATDIMCSNGIIHVIDAVILPAQANIVDTASEAGQFATLLNAAQAAGLASELAEGGDYTVLAPTDEAFDKLPRHTRRSLLQPENRELLAAILKNHVIPGRMYMSDILANTKVDTLNNPVLCAIRDGRVVVDNANVLKSDIDASNGVIHVIDRVIVPSR